MSETQRQIKLRIALDALRAAAELTPILGERTCIGLAVGMIEAVYDAAQRRAHDARMASS